MSALARWNLLSAPEAEAELLACCGSHRWAQTLVAQRPFAIPEALTQAAEALWLSLAEADWLEAFACHPRIGERKAAATAYLALSAYEQSSAQETLEPVAEALLLGNRAYEEKFGFLYIVFASGRTAPELLAVLESRLGNSRNEELQEAARQQMCITAQRMQKWLQP